jgi:hypothetical protein
VFLVFNRLKVRRQRKACDGEVFLAPCLWSLSFGTLLWIFWKEIAEGGR